MRVEVEGDMPTLSCLPPRFPVFVNRSGCKYTALLMGTETAEPHEPHVGPTASCAALDGVLFTENEWIPRQGLRAELF